MTVQSLRIRIEQARAFHGDDFTLIAEKCGCTEDKVRDAIARQDATAADDEWYVWHAAQQRHERLMAARRWKLEQRRRLLADLDRERRIVRRNALDARAAARREHTLTWKRLYRELNRPPAREDVA